MRGGTNLPPVQLDCGKAVRGKKRPAARGRQVAGPTTSGRSRRKWRRTRANSAGKYWLH